MKTNELIKHLRFCGDPEACCIGCSRLDEMGVDGGTNACMCNLMQQAANAIEELQTQLRDEMHRHDRLQDFEVAEAQDLATVKAERDALLAEMKREKGCGGCVHRDTQWNEEPCDSCRKDPKSPAWKWRGRS